MAQVQREVLGTIELCKNELRVHLGAHFDEYWRQLKDFFVFKLSKKDLDSMVNTLCGPKLHLHNSLVRAIMRDAVAKAIHHPKNVAQAAATTAHAFKRISRPHPAADAAAAAAATSSLKKVSSGEVASGTAPPKPKRKRPDTRKNPPTNASAPVASAASTAPANSEQPPKSEKRPPRPHKDGGDKDSKPSRPSSAAASALKRKEAAAAAAAAAASAAAAANGPKKSSRPSSSASAASKKTKEDPELERMQSAAKKADDEAEQSLRLQETFFREFTLIDGCDLNDSSAPLPNHMQIRRMMKRQVLECGIQDISKDAAKFVSDALDIYLQKLIQRMISTRNILRERKSSAVNSDLGFEKEHLHHVAAFASKNPQSLSQLQWAMWNSDVVLPSDMIMVFRQNPKMLGSNRQLSLEMLSAMPIHPYASRHQ